MKLTHDRLPRDWRPTESVGKEKTFIHEGQHGRLTLNQHGEELIDRQPIDPEVADARQLLLSLEQAAIILLDIANS